tara:strand:+ start:6619 stop:6813 length:195 start_codon:yes stop_codon:yes gene_type:complete
MFQRRHYQEIAEILKEVKHVMGRCYKEHYTVSHSAVCGLFAKRLEELNERFNSKIFFDTIFGDE